MQEGKCPNWTETLPFSPSQDLIFFQLGDHILTLLCVRGTAGLTQLSLADSSHIAQVMFGAVPLPSLRKVSVADGLLLPQISHIKGCGQTSVKPRG